MRKILAGAGALLMSATPVVAADLPVAPEPVEYVQICDAYGAGYFFIPGTDTCLRLRGRVRAEYRFNDFGGGRPSNWSDRTRNATSTRSRGYLRMDARTQTEYGLLRTYIDMFATVDTPGFVPNSGFNNQEGFPVGSFGNQFETDLTLDYAFVQFGGTTFGKAKSFFDFWTGYAYGAITTSAYSDANPWLAGYTADLGNGLSTSISVEDRTFRQQSLLAGDYLFPNNSPLGYGGHRFPNLVGNIRIDQGWGRAQIMGALQEVRYLSSYPGGRLGWAVGAGAEVDIPFLAGFQGVIQGAWGQGALGYIHSDWGTTIYDATELTDGQSGRATGWSLGAGLYADWSEDWNSALQFSYAHASQALIWNVNQWDVLGKIGWTPVTGFEIGAQVAYRNLNIQDLEAPAASPLQRPGNRDIISVLIRVQRDF